MGRIIAEQWLNVELSIVFAFFSDPRNLPSLMPKEMDVRLEELRLRPPTGRKTGVVVESGGSTGSSQQSGGNQDEIAGPGSQITISFRLIPYLPFRGRWVAEILEYQENFYFLDIQRSGPMRSWLHRHSFHEESRDGVRGTMIRDDVQYELPLGLLGRIGDALVVERMMNRTFATRQQQLESLFTSGS
jgi:ligand-binding SRPBCC domain-containing protein